MSKLKNPRVISSQITLTQDEDTAGRSGETDQFLQVEVVSPDGFTKYVVIETERWAMNEKEIREFAERLLDCLKRVEVEEDND